MNRNGPFALHHWQSYLIEPNVTMCLNGLRDVERNMANGEMLGVMLLMEDLVLGNKNNKNLNEAIESKPTSASTSRNSKLSIVAPTADLNQNEENEKTATKSVAKKSPLVLNYKKWRFFLLTWKRLEFLKQDWARRKLGLENINTYEAYSRFSENYRKDILLPVLKILVKSTDAQEIYDNVIDFKQPLLLPPDVSELDSKMKQVC